MTPYLIHGLGLTTYGLYVLVASISSTLSTFDGGIGGAAQRYFAVLAGDDMREQTTKLLCSLLGVVAVFGATVSAVDWLLAPMVVHLLHMPARLHAPAVVLLRTLAVLIAVSYVHGIFSGIVVARHRWSLFSVTSILSYLLWCAGMIIVVRHHYGLTGIAVVLVLQQVLATLMIVPRSLSYVSRHDVGFISFSEMKTFASYAMKIQLSSLSALVNLELDALVIGAALSVRLVGIYDVGASFALQLRGVVINALGPTKTQLSRTFGIYGLEAASVEMAQLQRLWISLVTGWSAVASAAAYFGIVSWLGPHFRESAIIAIVLLVGYAVNLYTGVMTAYAAAIGEPGIDARYGAVGMTVNVLLTIGLVITGPYGVVAATTAGQVISSIYLMKVVRQRLSPELPSVFSGIPYLRALVACALTIGLELALRPFAPTGPLGLLLCGVPAAIVLTLFVAATIGPKRLINQARQFVSRSSSSDSTSTSEHNPIA